MDDVLAKCLQGQKWAWDAFVERHAPVIFAAVGRCLRGGGARQLQWTEDIVQDVFVRLIKDDYHLLRSYDPDRSSLPTWLTLVARSVALDAVRVQRPPTIALEDAPPLADKSAPPSEEPTAELPPGLLSERQQLVLHMLYDQEMDIEQISGLLKVSAQTVRSTKHKALERLRQFYADNPAPDK